MLDLNLDMKEKEEEVRGEGSKGLEGRSYSDKATINKANLCS